MAVGTQNRKKGQKQYDLVLPDQIDFITDMVMAGDVVRVFHAHRCTLQQQSQKEALPGMHGGQLTSSGLPCVLKEGVWLRAEKLT